VALLSRAFLKERITPQVMMGIACAVGGIALVSLTKNSSAGGSSSLLGNVLLVGAVICEASYVVIGKKLTSNVSPKRISALINLWGLALVTPLGIWQALSFDFSAVAGASWWLLLFYSIAASMITVWLWMTGLKHVPASSAGIFTVLLPVSAAMVGVLFLGERFTAAQAGAFVLALAGVVLATWPSRAAPPLQQ
jgi:drug/metabolite transporter (DMT)-like permease